MTISISRRSVIAAAGVIGASAMLASRASASILGSLGLTKLLGQASDSALNKLGAPDGFYRDTAVRILLPGTTGKLARKLLSAGDRLGVTTKLTKSINDAASLAALEAKPVFRSAISGLKLSDVPGIAVQKDGASQYLQRTAGTELQTKVRPLIEAALNKVGAFQQLSSMNQAGGMLARLGITDVKLTDSVSQQAIKGIFSYLGTEEAQLRANPLRVL